MTGEINVFIRRLELVGCREPAVKLSAGYGQMDPVGRENGAMPCRQDKIPKHRADRYFGVTSEETAKPLKCKTDCFRAVRFIIGMSPGKRPKILWNMVSSFQIRDKEVYLDEKYR